MPDFTGLQQLYSLRARVRALRSFAFIFLTGLLCLLLVACGDDDNNSANGSSGTTSTPSVPAAAPSDVASAVPGQDAAGPLPKLKLTQAFGNLTFRLMTGMYAANDGSSRIFVTEQAGRVMVFDGSAQSPQASVYMDITRQVDSSSTEMGLLGFALAPDYATSGVFYVDYTVGNPRRTIIARFHSNPNRSTGDPASQEILLEIMQPFENHKGGQTIFGPDGFLYIGLGDGGSANDPMKNGQNLGVLLGKILRIDVSGTSTGKAYRIPSDNPFVGRAGAREEIWAWGLRNPWRFSFDSQTGALWVGDVGQSFREEIDLVTKGGNYGWNITEGKECRGGGSNCDKAGTIAPILDYPTGQNCAITGGFVYRGKAVESLAGAYVYGDYCSGRVWGLRYDGQSVTQQAEMADANFRISSFAMDGQGEIYALQHDNAGGIYKLTSN